MKRRNKGNEKSKDDRKVEQARKKKGKGGGGAENKKGKEKDRPVSCRQVVNVRWW